MTAHADIGALRDWRLKQLAAHEAATQRDPMASGVRLLMVDLREKLGVGEIGHDTLSALARRLHVTGESRQNRR